LITNFTYAKKESWPYYFTGYIGDLREEFLNESELKHDDVDTWNLKERFDKKKAAILNHPVFNEIMDAAFNTTSKNRKQELKNF